MDLTSSLIQVLLALGATVGLLLLCAFAARRLMGGLQRGDGQIEIVAVKALGSRERLVLVEVAGEATLLGVSPSGITALRELGELPPAPSADRQPRGEAPRGAFAGTLAQVLGRRS